MKVCVESIKRVSLLINILLKRLWTKGLGVEEPEQKYSNNVQTRILNTFWKRPSFEYTRFQMYGMFSIWRPCILFRVLARCVWLPSGLCGRKIHIIFVYRGKWECTHFERDFKTFDPYNGVNSLRGRKCVIIDFSDGARLFFCGITDSGCNFYPTREICASYYVIKRHNIFTL